MTNYLDVISSWCFWATPAWQELRERYSDPVDFQWKIALMDKTGSAADAGTHGMVLPTQRDADAFAGEVERQLGRARRHRISGAELRGGSRARFGIEDDRVWMALSRAELLEGKRSAHWEFRAEVGARPPELDRDQLLERAKSPEIEARIRESTAEFHALQVTQRPTFVIDTPIGDRAIFSGFAKVAPIAATIDAMLDDIVGYRAHAAHFGEPPA